LMLPRDQAQGRPSRPAMVKIRSGSRWGSTAEPDAW
jgi:hypothetical protein